jgi:hypothetical protein
MVLEDPGQPAGDIGSRRMTRVEDAPQLRNSSHPGLRPGLEHAPTGPGRLSTLLAPVQVPTTRCVNRHPAPVSQGMTSGELAASLRQIDGQRDKGKHPPDLPLQIEAVPALPQRSRPDLRRRPVRRALRAGHRINAKQRGSAGAGEGARHRRARVPAAEARVGAKGRTDIRAEPIRACVTSSNQLSNSGDQWVASCVLRIRSGLRSARRGVTQKLSPC